MRAVLALIGACIVLVLVLGAGDALAYPQFQLSHDTTCTGCHISPAGGGLLNENGLNTADVISQFGTDPAFMYGALDTPEWLSLGGDFRSMAGWSHAPQDYLLGLPMQADLYAHATKGSFGAQLTLGFRPANEGSDNEALTRLWAREHYLMWQSNPGEREGQFIRAGHLMPVFGLRFVEHPTYVRRYGGTPLFSETYGAAFSQISEKWELHISGFLKNPLMDAVRQENGVAAYGEARVAENTLVGAGMMFSASDWMKTYRYAVTAKHYLPTPGLLLQLEGQVVNPTFGAGYGFVSIVSNLMASYSVTESILVDLVLGHYDENLRIHAVDRDSVDLNVHWFATSHLELMLVSRFQMIGKGDGGDNSGWVFGQVHYRL